MGKDCKKRCVAPTSICKKQFMAMTGLLLCGFLLAHLSGNCLIYVSADAFNRYGHMLVTNPLILPAEMGLVALFLAHICMAIKLTVENKNARPQNYYLKSKTGRGATFASSTMPYTGMIILIFLVWHLITVKYGPYYVTQVDGKEMRDLYRLLAENFSNPLHVAGYIFCVSALGIHVSHGFWSAFQSFGINHPRCNCLLKCVSKIFGLLMALGYSALPLFLYLKGGKL